MIFHLIVNTHNHFDHIGGNRCFDLDVAMHREDAKAIRRRKMMMQLLPECLEDQWME